MLEKGSTSNPTGNLIVYCRVIGENPFQAGCEIIASNVVVSFLKINNNLPVVTFPPVSYPVLDDLQKVISRSSEIYDIARLPDFIMPDNKEQGGKYIQERMEQYNSFVMRYVDYCKAKEKTSEVVNLVDDFDENIHTLMQFSFQYRNSTGLAREVAKHKVDSLIQEISIKYPQLDLENYRSTLYSIPGPKGEEIASLYLKKFHAIQLEEYETASVLKMKIQDLETNFR
jgi:hypothetical protein